MFLLSSPDDDGKDQRMHSFRPDSFRLGDATITSLPFFDNWPLSPGEFFPGSEQRDWEGNASWLSPAHWDRATNRVHIVVRSWLLQQGAFTILIDTGLASATERPEIPNGGSLVSALAGQGVAPDDIDAVICTHLHADHVGWNTTGGTASTPTFPNARYYFSRADVEFFDAAALASNPDPEPGRSASVFLASIEPVIQSGQAEIWDDTVGVGEGIDLESAPGHTPGAGIVRVVSQGERALFIGDVLHSPMQVLRPELSSRFCFSPAEAAATRRRVLGLAADAGALVLPAHFAGAGAVRIAREADGFTIVDP
jgi:glyoxylase-like metal-dependent hydrolase (beta-lactamase superfamily II)